MRRLISSLLGAAVVAGALALSAPAGASTSPVTAYDAGIQVIYSDTGASVALPGGRTLWAAGDTLQVNHVATCCAYGYPHNVLYTEARGSADFRPLPGRFGYGWQAVPNWPDGTFFWPGGFLATATTVYLYGAEVRAPGTVVGDAVAWFSASTLAFEGRVRLRSAQMWSNAVPAAGGWWMFGTTGTSVKTGTVAWVPAGAQLSPRKWRITHGVMPGSLDVGTTLAVIHWQGAWYCFTKRGDAYFGNQVEELRASSPLGHWTLTGHTWPALSPPGTYTYSVEAHPQDGWLLLSYAVGGDPSQMFLRFLIVKP
jgi:hypothetical protein